jgi:hypothetical protein
MCDRFAVFGACAVRARASVGSHRKAFTAAGFTLQAGSFLSMSRLRGDCVVGSDLWNPPAGCEDFHAAVALLTLGVGLGGLIFAGFNATWTEIAPDYAGEILGISNSFATLPGVIGNLVTGALLSGHTHDWTLVFMIAACFYAAGAIVYVCFAKVEVLF